MKGTLYIAQEPPLTEPDEFDKQRNPLGGYVVIAHDPNIGYLIHAAPGKEPIGVEVGRDWSQVTEKYPQLVDKVFRTVWESNDLDERDNKIVRYDSKAVRKTQGRVSKIIADDLPPHDWL